MQYFWIKFLYHCGVLSYPSRKDFYARTNRHFHLQADSEFKTQAKLQDLCQTPYSAFEIHRSSHHSQISRLHLEYAIFAHDFYQPKLYPTYDMQLHKIAHYIAQKMGSIHIIDVGANIGDTAVFMNMPQAQFLLIEGEKSYNALIETNFYRHYGEAIRGGGYL